MKLLFDQNLSPSLAHHFATAYPGTSHVQNLGLERADDLTVWNRANESGYTLVSKDSDFADLQATLGYPPKVIWIVAGNVTTAEIRQKI